MTSRKGTKLDPSDPGPRSQLFKDVRPGSVLRSKENGNSTGDVLPSHKSTATRRDNVKENNRPKDSAQLTKVLSRSHDNLASTLRKKAAAASLMDNNTNSKDRVGSPVLGGKFKTPRAPGTSSSTPIRKAHSQQSIAKDDEPIKRAQSAQNISSGGKTAAPEQTAVKKLQNNVPKRAVSSQNISNKQKNRQARNSSSALAYNAELLASFEKEKRALEHRISDGIQLAENRKSENELLRFEVKNLKAQIPSQNVLDELAILRNENTTFKGKLHELGVTLEHSTDSEKLLVLQKEQDTRINDDNSEHNTNNMGTCDSELCRSVGDLSCLTPEHPSSISLDNNWDKSSNKSDALSEVSLACLQDRILQMEETHYSTNEELQATLQELTDLQDAVNQLTEENECLADEKSVLLESLCAQTEKLENCRMQMEQLKILLVNDSRTADRSDTERQLVALIKSSEEEKEELYLRQVELSNLITNLEGREREQFDIIQALKDKAAILELKNEGVSSDKRALDVQLSEVKETLAKENIELKRFKSLYEHEKQKVSEMEQFRKVTDKSELEELLDNAREEKERLEEQLTNIQEELGVSQNRVSRLEQANESLEQQVTVLTNNTKSQVDDLEYKLDKKEHEQMELQEEINSLRDHIDQLQMDCDRYLDEKKTFNATVSGLEQDLKACRLKSAEFEAEAKELRNKYVEDQQEWKQFQCDLQTAVVIANDIKVESQDELERLATENAALADWKAEKEEELGALHAEVTRLHTQKDQVSGIHGKVISTVNRELANLRTTRKPSDLKTANMSVKNIIQTIEEQAKKDQVKVASPLSPTSSPLSPISRRDSIDSNFSFSSLKSETSGSPRGAVDAVSRRASSGEGAYKALLRNKGATETKEGRSPISHRHTIAGISSIIYESAPATDDKKSASSQSTSKSHDSPDGGKKGLMSILKEPHKSAIRRGSGGPEKEASPDKTFSHAAAHKSDPLGNLAKEMGGSKRNALLTWCKLKTATYTGIDITNFSSSWNDGLAFCALMHCYLPHRIPYRELSSQDQQRNFTLAFKAAEGEGIPSNLAVSDMVAMERPDWQAVMNYVTSIYKHFECDIKS